MVLRGVETDGRKVRRRELSDSGRAASGDKGQGVTV